jgi:succinate dehydrogenase / fumarate reductase membrane anchor subunit
MSQSPHSMTTPLKRVRGLGSARSGTDHFWKQRLTAMSNAVLVIGFIWIVLSVTGKDAAQAKVTLSHPLVGLTLLLFIASITLHMRIGMQVIIEDYIHEEGPKVLALALNTFFAIAVGAACAFAVLKLSFGA